MADWTRFNSPPVGVVVLVTIECDDGVRYIELAEYSGRIPTWMLVGGEAIPGRLIAWMTAPAPLPKGKENGR